MNDKLQKLVESFIPYIVMGVAITLFIGLLFMFSYLLLWGLLIGVILWLISHIAQYLYPDKSKTKENGRIIEHDSKK